ncbi:MAG: YkvA family protein [Oscillospiraceae bacterium]|nr:YkvA family protein [Oscillospiraceae bacterium]
MNLKEIINEITLQLAALSLAYKHPQVSWPAKLLCVLTVGYALSPIDFIPDFIPFLGYLDDLIILPFLIWLCLKMIPSPVMLQCRESAKDLWKNGKPKKWYYAIPIILLWALLLFLVVRPFLP